MKTKLTLAILLAAATLGTSAYAHGGDRDDRGWEGRRDHGRDHWQHQRHEDWRYDRRRHDWRHEHRRPPYAYGYGYPPPPRYYAPPPAPRANVYIPLPPPPHEVLRDILRGRH